MDVGSVRSLHNHCCISRDQGSDSEILPISRGCALLHCYPNAGDLLPLYENSHSEQFIVRLGHLDVSKAPAIPTMAAAVYCGSNFWFGGSDSLSCWHRRRDSMPLLAVQRRW